MLRYSEDDAVSESRLFSEESTTDSSYRRLFDLSEGGMGKVELAIRKDGRFERLYAVKRLQPSIRDDQASREMFIEEARLAGLIQSPHVVGVLDVGEDAGGPFLAMQYIEGVTVRDIIKQSSADGLLLPVQLCCRIIAQAARGLEAAHGLTSLDGSPLNLVHRDISPHNILVGFDGVARVVDFGIARALGRDHRTSTGILKGKLGYMAPETLRFEKPDARSDLFALGVVLFEMLAVRRLYGGKDDAARARRIVSEPPPELGELRDDAPPMLEQLLMRMLAKEPEHRPTSSREVADALEALVAEMVLEEGAVRVADHLEETFAQVREERRAEIGTRLEVLGNERTPPSDALRGQRRLPLLGAAALTTIGLTAATLFYVSQSGPDHAVRETPDTPHTSAAESSRVTPAQPTSLEDARLAPPPSRGPELEATPEEPPATGDRQAENEAAPDETVDAPARRARSRRVRHPAGPAEPAEPPPSPPASPAAGRGGPIWGFEGLEQESP